MKSLPWGWSLRRIDWSKPVYLAVGLLALGWLRLAARSPDTFTWSVPFYAALHIAWPWDQGTRYFAPLLPALVACLWWGLTRLAEVQRLRVFAALTVAHAAVALGYWLAVDLPRGRADHPRERRVDRPDRGHEPEVGRLVLPLQVQHRSQDQHRQPDEGQREGRDGQRGRAPRRRRRAGSR